MRMGDILQTTPLIASLRAKHPGARIDMIINEGFLEVGNRVGVDTVYPFPVHSFRGMLSREEGFPFQAYKNLNDFLRTLNENESYDTVVNLTPSRFGAALGSLISNTAYVGMGIQEDGSFQAMDPWTAYLVAMMSNRRNNPFHLVDIWLRTMKQPGAGRGLHMDLVPEDFKQAQALLTASGLCPDRDVLIGFQVSASEKEKCWSEKEFVRLGQMLARNLKARIVLFGVEAENGLCTRIQTEIPGAVNLAGKTGLGDLAVLLKRCRMLISNDTGTLHVATAMGTPVIVVSVGPVFFRETGPYGEGHWVFQARLPCSPCSFHTSCPRPVCKEKIRAEDIFSVVDPVLRGEKEVPTEFSADLACYRSGIDDQGFLEFFSCNPQAEDKKLSLYKGLWQVLLEGTVPETSPLSDACLDPDTLAGWSRLDFLLQRAVKLIRQMHGTGQDQGANAFRWEILTGNFKTVEKEMKQLALEVIDIFPFVNYLLLRREALSLHDPLQFLKGASSLYALMAEQVDRRVLNPYETEVISDGRQ